LRLSSRKVLKVHRVLKVHKVLKVPEGLHRLRLNPEDLEDPEDPEDLLSISVAI
jgi:hypothetical protein